jgi:Glycosyl hydrolase family 63 C-terminal domain
MTQDSESVRLAEDDRRLKNWKRWGTYLAERQWGTVREDYSAGGEVWTYLPHDHARSRAYRWGEDGLLGWCDRECRLCFAPALWNGRDPILKERLFGLGGPEGNHGEDVKEAYFYLDATPCHSYAKALYKYPHAEFPYRLLHEENARRGRDKGELELEDTGIFDGDRYLDVFVEYAKASPDDTLIRITLVNRGPEAVTSHLLPTLWFRNTWVWGRTGGKYWPKPRIWREAGGSSLLAGGAAGAAAPPERGGATAGRGGVNRSSAPEDEAGPALIAEHATLGRFVLRAASPPAAVLFTDNETNTERLFAYPNASPYVKDAFHQAVVGGRPEAVNPRQEGTKAALHYVFELAPGGEATVCLRLHAAAEAVGEAFGGGFQAVFDRRRREADAFHAARQRPELSEDERRIARQAVAGLLWSKQYYGYVVKEWLEGDPGQPPPPAGRGSGRNAEWNHFHADDVLSMPDKWEYPWFAAWDLAFHAVCFARVDPAFAKQQLILLKREWYMHPNGQLPAYEFAFADVNPPVHAWASWRVYKMTAPKGERDRLFLERSFQKLLLSFTWWVNRKDLEGKNLFSGGFLGLDNIGIFDRSRPLPTGGYLDQADGTAWMAFVCASLLSMAMELARHDPAYEDLASKFFEHFVAISDAMNTLGGSGLWDEDDGFYYDQLNFGGVRIPLRVRSMVGIIPLFAVSTLSETFYGKLHGFTKRLRWFLENRQDLARHLTFMDSPKHPDDTLRLLAIPSRERLVRVLRYVLDEQEFLSPFGVRSLSRAHRERPYRFQVGAETYAVDYEPGESRSGLFGGNSNWRGPIWFPLNYLLIEALEKYHHFYRDTLRVECPTGSGRLMNLDEVAQELRRRLVRIFQRDARGRRPCHGDDRRFAEDEHWRDLLLFHEYFHGDTGRGLGAAHQTGWTALAALVLNDARKWSAHAAAAGAGAAEAQAAGGAGAAGAGAGAAGATGGGRLSRKRRRSAGARPASAGRGEGGG